MSCAPAAARGRSSATHWSYCAESRTILSSKRAINASVVCASIAVRISALLGGVSPHLVNSSQAERNRAIAENALPIRSPSSRRGPAARATPGRVGVSSKASRSLRASHFGTPLSYVMPPLISSLKFLETQ